MLSPEGRVVMISGANRGIGLATANLLAERGYKLSLGARDLGALETATMHLPQDRTARFEWDATRPKTSPAWAEGTLIRFGRIDAVVANAGISPRARLDDDDETAIDEMWEVNFKGPLRVIRAALPALRDSGHGRVVNVASLAGKRVLSDNFGYSASKFAAVALTHALRRAGWEDGLRATALCPGMVDTDMVASAQIPEGQFKIEPDAIAESVAYVLSLPNNATVAELLVNSRFEPAI
ncbi:MAG: SDR family NAD(P)-dependent oxidoreductase [Paracoccaceae bacterium]|nr:SDR family NAD(P)-dependent oxidoreductase [Paracoccaceae bacterium]